MIRFVVTLTLVGVVIGANVLSGEVGLNNSLAEVLGEELGDSVLLAGVGVGRGDWIILGEIGKLLPDKAKTA